MRVLMWHGWLLTGSGSNIMTANVAREWRRIGHDVLLLCQERSREIPYVDAAGDFDPGNEVVEFRPSDASPARGRCRIARPDIGGVLPVFVFDDYPGFQVKRFVDLTDEELETYKRRNEDALRSAVESYKPDAVVTGHEVMGPAIAQGALQASGLSYLAKLHGSGLEYAVKEQDRYLRHAQVGLGGAQVVTGGSAYMVREAARVVSGWEERAAVVNPGCDADLFRPRPRRTTSAFHVGYVGKFLTAKGVHNLVCALALTGPPHLRATIVGYGGFDSGLRAFTRALCEGNLTDARAHLEGESEPLVRAALRFLDSADPAAVGGRLSGIDIGFPGRLDHGPLAEVLPDFDVLVVPSIVPEAFGMVAAEAAAAGVLPIVPDHSGIAEIGLALEEILGRPGLLTYSAQRPIEGIAERVDVISALDVSERDRLRFAASDFARDRWSWRSVAERLLALAIGTSGGAVASLEA